MQGMDALLARQFSRHESQTMASTRCFRVLLAFKSHAARDASRMTEETCFRNHSRVGRSAPSGRVTFEIEGIDCL